MTLKSEIIRFFLAAGFLACLRSNAGPTSGGEYIKIKMPFLHAAVVRAVGEEKTANLFNGWGKEEVELVVGKLGNFFLEVAKASPDPQTRAKIFENYYGPVIGTLGEAYGGVLLKKRYGITSGGLTDFRFENEQRYRSENRNAANVSNNRPDGVVYKVQGDKVVLTKILEGKLGFTHFNSAQAAGYLERWKQVGVTLDGRHFDPNSIYLQTGEGLLPIDRVDLEKLKQHTMVVRSVLREKPQSYEQVLIPLDFDEMEGTVRELVSQNVSERVRKELFQMVGRNGRLADLISFMTEKMRETGKARMPSNGSTDPNEKYWAEWILRNGGQPETYQMIREFRPSLAKVLIRDGYNLENLRSKWRKEGKLTLAGLMEWMKAQDEYRQNGIARFPPSYTSWAHFVGKEGGQADLYQRILEKDPALAKSILAGGFDPNNPIGSAVKRTLQNGGAKNVERFMEYIRELASYKNGHANFTQIKKYWKDWIKSLKNPQTGSTGQKAVYEMILQSDPQMAGVFTKDGFDPENPLLSSINKKRIWGKVGTITLNDVLSHLRKQKSFVEGVAYLPTLPTRLRRWISRQQNLATGQSGQAWGYELILKKDPDVAAALVAGGFDPMNPYGSARRLTAEKKGKRTLKRFIEFLTGQPEYSQGLAYFPRIRSEWGPWVYNQKDKENGRLGQEAVYYQLQKVAPDVAAALDRGGFDARSLSPRKERSGQMNFLNPTIECKKILSELHETGNAQSRN